MSHAKHMTIALVGVGLATVPLSAVGPNDDCANAIAISGEGVFDFDNTDATADEVPPPDCTHEYGSSDGFVADVWFRWTSDRAGYVTLGTCGGTTVDTKLAVYRDDCFYQPYYARGCDDDGCHTQSQVSIEVIHGESYMIRIGTHPGLHGGTGTLRIERGMPPESPPLDCYTAATPTFPFAQCAYRSRWDALNSTRGQQRVFDDFTADADGVIQTICWAGTYLDDEAECRRGLVDFFELTYYADDCGVPGEIIAGPFSQEDVTMTVAGPSATHLTFPDGVREFEYSVYHSPVPVVAGERYWVGINNSYYNRCAWFWETSLGSTGYAVALDDESGALASVGTDLAFCFDIEYENAAGCLPSPVNDDCVDAVEIQLGETAFDTAGATTDGPINRPWDQSAPPSCDFPLGDEQVHRDIWYDFIAACTGAVELSLCDSTFDTKAAVYDGRMCPPATSAIACDDDGCGESPPRQSVVAARVVAGGEYKVRVGGYAEASGIGTLRMRYAVPPRPTLADFSALAVGYTGACSSSPCDEPLAAGCGTAQDFDADGDVDSADYAALHRFWAGP